MSLRKKEKKSKNRVRKSVASGMSSFDGEDMVLELKGLSAVDASN